MTDQEAPSLTDKQQVFVEEYLACWNATEAARRAGYAGSDATLATMGWENLRKPEIAARIKQRMEEKAMDANEVLARLADQARGTMEDFFTIGPRGSVKLDLARARRAGKLHLVKKYSKSRKGTMIELYDAQAALVHLGRHLALFTDRQDITSGGEPLKQALSDEGFDRAISTLADALREVLPGASVQQDCPVDPTEQAPVAGDPDPSG